MKFGERDDDRRALRRRKTTSSAAPGAAALAANRATSAIAKNMTLYLLSSAMPVAAPAASHSEDRPSLTIRTT